MNKPFFGVDLSHWNRIQDFEKASKEVDFVILKAGGSDRGFYKDKTFEEKYTMFHDVWNIPAGVYYFVGKNCISYQDGIEDAKRLLQIIKGKKFEYPIVIDLEATATKNKKGATDAVIGFKNCIESFGYYAMVYASDISGFYDRLELSRLDKIDKWVARYGSKPKIVKQYGIWQYSSTGRINGIMGAVDLDYSYKDYPAIMKKAHLNGF